MLRINKTLFLLIALLSHSTIFSQGTESKEIVTLPNPTVSIESAGHDIIISAWDENKVKVVVESDDTKLLPPGKNLFEGFYITLNGNASTVRIRVDWKRFQGDGLKKIVQGNVKPLKARMTVYLPARSGLNIDNRFSDIVLNNDFAEADFRLVGGELVAFNIDKLRLDAQLAKIRIGNVIKANVVLEGNHKLYAKRIETLHIKSNGSDISYDGGRYAYIESEIDKYSIGTIDTLICSKTSGTLVVSAVAKSLELQGSNADMTIRTISPAVKNVQVINRHATIRVPLNSFKNLKLDFEGLNSIVHTPIEVVVPKSAASIKRTNYDPQFAPTKFTSSRGIVNENATIVKVFCDACILDMR
jgi:hypothetical protein